MGTWLDMFANQCMYIIGFIISLHTIDAMDQTWRFKHLQTEDVKTQPPDGSTGQLSGKTERRSSMTPLMRVCLKIMWKMDEHRVFPQQNWWKLDLWWENDDNPTVDFGLPHVETYSFTCFLTFFQIPWKCFRSKPPNQERRNKTIARSLYSPVKPTSINHSPRKETLLMNI